MNIKITAVKSLENFLNILYKYNFNSTEHDRHDKPVEGTIQLETLDELFELTTAIRRQFEKMEPDHNLADVLVIKQPDPEWHCKIEIYDDYRE